IPVEALAVIADYVIDRADFQLSARLKPLWTKKDKYKLDKIFLMLITAATYEDLSNYAHAEFYATHSPRYKRLRELAPVLGINIKEMEAAIKPKDEEKINNMKERFILRNKFDHEKPNKKASKKKGRVN